MCMQAHFLREPTYYNNLSRSLLASLWWDGCKPKFRKKTHLVEESYGSPQMFPLKQVIGRNEKSKVFFFFLFNASKENGSEV